eukprot:570840-Pelagomonas_calceolata.AAC.5
MLPLYRLQLLSRPCAFAMLQSTVNAAGLRSVGCLGQVVVLVLCGVPCLLRTTWAYLRACFLCFQCPQGQHWTPQPFWGQTAGFASHLPSFSSPTGSALDASTVLGSNRRVRFTSAFVLITHRVSTGRLNRFLAKLRARVAGGGGIAREAARLKYLTQVSSVLI